MSGGSSTRRKKSLMNPWMLTFALTQVCSAESRRQVRVGNVQICVVQRVKWEGRVD